MNGPQWKQPVLSVNNRFVTCPNRIQSTSPKERLIVVDNSQDAIVSYDPRYSDFKNALAELGGRLLLRVREGLTRGDCDRQQQRRS